MTRVLTKTMLRDNVVDAYARRIHLGDRIVDLNAGCVCVILDHCPELGPESVYVQILDADIPTMSYWVNPVNVVKLPRKAA
ncbi:MAG: hypothetical protein ACYTDT_13460 [Planctomycetota bacterium]